MAICCYCITLNLPGLNKTNRIISSMTARELIEPLSSPVAIPESSKNELTETRIKNCENEVSQKLALNHHKS